MAEFIMKEFVRRACLEDSFAISSAAVSYEEQGNSLYPPAAAKLREKGIPFTAHAAHRITPAEAAAWRDTLADAYRGHAQIPRHEAEDPGYVSVETCAGEPPAFPPRRPGPTPRWGTGPCA